MKQKTKIKWRINFKEKKKSVNPMWRHRGSERSLKKKKKSLKKEKKIFCEIAEEETRGKENGIIEPGFE